MFEEITPADLVKVLDYNGYKDKKDYCLSFTEEKISYSSKNKQDYLWTIRFDAGLKVWLPLLETVTGKLKPLPKFDFEAHLIEHGFKKFTQGNPILTKNGIVIQCGSSYCFPYITDSAAVVKPTKENADKLIEASKILQKD